MSIEQVSTGTHEVQETLDKLRLLQDVLHKKHILEAEVEELPKSLLSKNQVLDQLRRAYIEHNEEQESAKEQIESLRANALESERVREGYEGQMDQIRTQREYEALDKQIRDAADREMDYRRGLEEEQERLEQISEELIREADAIAKHEGIVSEEESRLKAELSDRNKQLTGLEKEEKKVAKDLDEELLFKFERIVRSTEGYGIVPLEGNCCTGCYMNLPAHFVNRVRSASEVLFCTHGRLVFYQNPPDEDESENQIEVFDDEPGFFAAEDDGNEDEEELFLDVAESFDLQDQGDENAGTGEHDEHDEHDAHHEHDEDDEDDEHDAHDEDDEDDEQNEDEVEQEAEGD